MCDNCNFKIEIGEGYWTDENSDICMGCIHEVIKYDISERNDMNYKYRIMQPQQLLNTEEHNQHDTLEEAED